MQRLRGQIARAGFTMVREELHLTGTFRSLPGPIPAWLRDSALTQDIVIGNMEYVLQCTCVIGASGAVHRVRRCKRALGLARGAGCQVRALGLSRT